MGKVLKKIERKIRLSQALTTFGVGAIINTQDESFINQDISWWVGKKIDLRLPRLENTLNISHFKQLKPTTETNYNNRNIGFLSLFRFPRWLFCKQCRKMEYITNDKAKELDGDVPTCNSSQCKDRKLTPMRFITICENGHIQDFPWFDWAHSRNIVEDHGRCDRYKARYKARLMYLYNPKRGASYQALSVYCTTCKLSRDLGGLEKKESLKMINFQCSGRQPWDRVDNAVDCKETPWMRQKNASLIYQPVIVSAIDIPTENKTYSNSSELDESITNNVTFKMLKSIFDSSNDDSIDFLIPQIQQLALNENWSEDNIIRLLKNQRTEDKINNENLSYENPNQIILSEEWPVFFENHKTKVFVNSNEELFKTENKSYEAALKPLISHVSLIHKLREVRALKGFTRLRFDPGTTIPADLGKGLDWLPAVEVFGEGIFIALNQEKIDEWYLSHKAQIDSENEEIRKRYTAKENQDWVQPFSAKFILLHTLSHLLIDQLAFESGYNSSSLRESIYFSDKKELKMAGILIYTADSDSEGSLGGLVRQGQDDRFVPTLITSIRKARWCSADPICSEKTDSLSYNQAACHSCALIAETSCTHFNSMLNRKLLIDTKIGFFKDLVKTLNAL